MKVILEFKGSHHYEQDYRKSDMYCPSCGEKDIWENEGHGDYYLGTDYICTACESSHALDHSSKIETEAYTAVVRQLKSGIAIKPSTRTGN